MSPTQPPTPPPSPSAPPPPDRPKLWAFHDARDFTLNGNDYGVVARVDLHGESSADGTFTGRIAATLSNPIVAESIRRADRGRLTFVATLAGTGGSIVRVEADGVGFIDRRRHDAKWIVLTGDFESAKMSLPF